MATRDRRQQGRHSAGRPDHHNPFGGIGGAPPAYSALTLRLVLAAFGLVVCVTGAVVSFAVGVWTLGVVLIVLAVIAVVDIGVISYRKRRGEPG